MGDVLTLIEQAEKVFDSKQAEKLLGKFRRFEFTLEDFFGTAFSNTQNGLHMKKNVVNVAGAGKIREQLENFDEIDRTEAIVRSMTPAERADLKLFECFTQGEDSQRFRCDCCSNKCLSKRFEQAKTMMSALW